MISCSFSSVTPRAIASYIANMRWSVHLPISSSSSSTLRFAIDFIRSVSQPISAPRTAFISACSTFTPIAITSPVAFICVPRVRLPYTNLSNGHFGIFATI